ncbi:MAG: DUF4124 domain-containing protein [Burkholderiales bacterium]
MKILMMMALLAALSATALGSEIHRWTDADGRVHYGQRPPAGQKADALNLGATPSAGPNPNAGANTKDSVTSESEKIRQQEREFQQRHRARLDRDADAENARERARAAEAQAKRAEAIARAERDAQLREQGARAARTRQSKWGM